MATKVNVFKNGTNVRSGGFRPRNPGDPDNVVTTVDAGMYEALYQCAGQDVTEGNDRNYWWVKIRAGNREGWVSAVRIRSGVNDRPVPDVEVRPTAFV
jgi:hypothetical protein